MLQNHIINKNFIEPILQNPNTNTKENKNTVYKNQFFIIIDKMIKQLEHRDCFCYFIDIELKNEDIYTAIEIIHTLTDLIFYTYAVEDAKTGESNVYIYI